MNDGCSGYKDFLLSQQPDVSVDHRLEHICNLLWLRITVIVIPTAKASANLGVMNIVPGAINTWRSDVVKAICRDRSS